MTNYVCMYYDIIKILVSFSCMASIRYIELPTLRPDSTTKIFWKICCWPLLRKVCFLDRHSSRITIRSILLSWQRIGCQNNNVALLDRPSQFPLFNPQTKIFGESWNKELEKIFFKITISYGIFFQNTWYAIPVESCRKPKRTNKIIENNYAYAGKQLIFLLLFLHVLTPCTYYFVQ